MRAAAAELQRLDAKLLEVIDLKPTIARIEEEFAAGKVELVHAAAILTHPVRTGTRSSKP